VTTKETMMDERPTRPRDDDSEEKTFAEGQSTQPAARRDTPRQHFARGQQDTEHEHEGTFAEGQAEMEPHPEDEPRGRYARGLETDDRSDTPDAPGRD
jgi:hypothetical protein